MADIDIVMCKVSQLLRLLASVGTMMSAQGLLSPAWAGEIKGQVVISTTLTKRRVTIPNYQARGPAMPASLPKQTSPQQTSVDEFKRIAIYLEKAGTPLPSFTTATLTQKGQRFEPEIVIVPVGSTVSFPNEDPIFHNVFSLSKARAFDLGYYPAGETREVKFDAPGIAQVYCHLHSDMSAAVVVVPTQWYSQPDEHGSFSFPGLSAGSYRVVLWHKSAGFFIRKVELEEAGTLDFSFKIPIKEHPQQ